MSGRLRQEDGFTLVEVVVAMTLLAICALGFATQFVGQAQLTKNSTQRQKALELANQQLSRARTLAYDNVKLDPTGAASNPDWLTTFCPLRNDPTQPQSGTNPPRCQEAVLNAAAAGQPAKDIVGTAPSVSKGIFGKDAPQRRDGYGSSAFFTGLSCATLSNCPTVAVNGIILYTYVYYNNWNDSSLPRLHKVVKVVARYDDRSSYANGGTVEVAAAVADLPSIGQIK